nr:MAG TPA: Ribosomal protein L11 methyltransferase [Caudoviricetes sp.]
MLLGVDFLKVQNTRRIAEKLMEVMQLKEASSMVNTIITNSIVANSIIPPDPEALRKEAELIQKEMPDYSVDRIMMLLMVESMIGPYLEQQPEVMDFFMNWIAAESRVFDVSEFNENPYIKNIDFANQSNGDYELRYHDNMPYELDIYNVPKRIEELYVDIPRVSCFPEEFKYPVIFQKSINSTWMSVSPNEVFTMEKAIKNAKGKVLTLGCGMGYFAYMASIKEDVDSVTIIELEQSVIDLFETCLLSQFENKNKITVIKADAVEYLKNMEDGDFDYCFADIWIGIEDIIPYFAVKEIGRKLRKTKIDYWIEDSFAILLSSYVWIEIIKSFSKSNNIPIPPIDDSMLTDLDKRKTAYIQSLLGKVEITKPEHIDYYMRPQNIISLIDRTDIIF